MRKEVLRLTVLVAMLAPFRLEAISKFPLLQWAIRPV